MRVIWSGEKYAPTAADCAADAVFTMMQDEPYYLRLEDEAAEADLTLDTIAAGVRLIELTEEELGWAAGTILLANNDYEEN